MASGSLTRRLIMAGPLFTVLFFARGCFGKENSQTNTSEIGVSKAILKYVPPYREGRLPMQLYFTIDFLDIRNIDTMKRRFWTKFLLSVEWNDPRVPSYLINDLKMKPQDEWRLNDSEDFWMPNVFWFEHSMGPVDDTLEFLRVQANGNICWDVRLSMYLDCDMDFKNFPHDTQTCLMTFESYFSYSEEVILQWSKRNEDPPRKHSFGDTGFSLENISYDEVLVMRAVGNDTRLIIDLKFKRNIGLYMRQLYFPNIMLIVVTSLTFWISYDFIALRLSLLLSALLLMTAQSLEAGNSIPSTPYMKPVDLWIGTCFGFMCVAMIEYVLVFQIASHREKTDIGETEINSVEKLDEDAGVNMEKKKTVAKLKQSTVKRVASRLFRSRHSDVQIDATFRYLYPALFGIFNIIYWGKYSG